MVYVTANELKAILKDLFRDLKAENIKDMSFFEIYDKIDETVDLHTYNGG